MFLLYNVEMLRSSSLTWRTSESTPGRTRCTWPRRSCRAARSRAPAGRRGLDHTIMNISTAAPRESIICEHHKTRKLKTHRTGTNERVVAYFMQNQPQPQRMIMNFLLILRGD